MTKINPHAGYAEDVIPDLSAQSKSAETVETPKQLDYLKAHILDEVALERDALAAQVATLLAENKELRSASEFSLRHLQTHLPWTLPYSEHFEKTAYPLDRVKHDVLHVMKSLGRIAAECENHDHGRDRKLYGEALAKEVSDLVICALHIARIEGFDLHDAVVKFSEARNMAKIPSTDSRGHGE